MPELPEVEVVRRGLEQMVVGRRFAQVEVLHPRAVRRHLPTPADFAGRLSGQQVLGACRRGKYFWLPLESGEMLLGHLGMSGQLLFRPAETPDETHLRVRFCFTDAGPQLRFVDQRTFGGLLVSRGGVPVPPEIAHIARDPLDPEFSDADFARAVRARQTGTKRALLDQSLVSGVGNIYADEGLWRAGLHYARPTESLSHNEVARILDGVRTVMTAALAAGGTTFDSLYVNVNGQSGYFERSLEVYGRSGEPCSRCGTPIRRDAFMNRSAYTCPKCQPRPRRARW